MSDGRGVESGCGADAAGVERWGGPRRVGGGAAGPPRVLLEPKIVPARTRELDRARAAKKAAKNAAAAADAGSSEPPPWRSAGGDGGASGTQKVKKCTPSQEFSCKCLLAWVYQNGGFRWCPAAEISTAVLVAVRNGAATRDAELDTKRLGDCECRYLAHWALSVSSKRCCRCDQRCPAGAARRGPGRAVARRIGEAASSDLGSSRASH